MKRVLHRTVSFTALLEMVDVTRLGVMSAPVLSVTLTPWCAWTVSLKCKVTTLPVVGLMVGFVEEVIDGKFTCNTGLIVSSSVTEKAYGELPLASIPTQMDEKPGCCHRRGRPATGCRGSDQA